jgi:hypothetical protein
VTGFRFGAIKMLRIKNGNHIAGEVLLTGDGFNVASKVHIKKKNHAVMHDVKFYTCS